MIGTIATVMTVFKRMQERNEGQIAITSSIAGYYSIPQMCHYNATKAALVSFGRDLRFIGRSYNVKVSVITPGFIASHMTLHEDQPMPLPSWFMASPGKLSKIIQWQLWENNFVIAWPFFEFIVPFVANALPPRVVDTVHFLIGRAWGFFSPTGDLAFT